LIERAIVPQPEGACYIHYFSTEVASPRLISRMFVLINQAAGLLHLMAQRQRADNRSIDDSNGSRPSPARQGTGIRAYREVSP
jgi:hypothetical protein